MIEKETDLISLLEKSLSARPLETFEEVGKVIKVADGISHVYGLSNAVYGELIKFENGNSGIILNLDEDYVSVIILDKTIPIVEGEIAKRTGDILRVPVSDTILGRVVNATGKPIDALGEISHTQKYAIERIAPGIADRSPVNQPLETGITVIDSLIPIGKGQRELLIGNRNTGKTAVALDIILNQKDKDVICIYVTIGHKQSNTARILDFLEKHNAMSYSIIVNADANETAINQYLAPYTGCTIAEYFMNKGKDVLIIYDSLTNHAIAYRELSLLLKRPPGREAYPGDIFYIHSRLLERACKLSAKNGGGSITAIPIVQTQSDDLSAYIPTNLISITDGQIVFDSNLFNNGIRPAVNIGLSVSRVGKAAQTSTMKKVSGSLKLELAQYESLLAFAQFGSELDKASQKVLDRGRRAQELLKQNLHQTFSLTDQVIFLLLLREKVLDDLPFEEISDFAIRFASYVSKVYPQTYEAIKTSENLSDELAQRLMDYAGEFKLTIATPKRNT